MCPSAAGSIQHYHLHNGQRANNFRAAFPIYSSRSAGYGKTVAAVEEDPGTLNSSIQSALTINSTCPPPCDVALLPTSSSSSSFDAMKTRLSSFPFATNYKLYWPRPPPQWWCCCCCCSVCSNACPPAVFKPAQHLYLSIHPASQPPPLQWTAPLYHSLSTLYKSSTH